MKETILDLNNKEKLMLLHILYTLRSKIIIYRCENSTVDETNEQHTFEIFIDNLIREIESSISYYDYHYIEKNKDFQQLCDTYRKNLNN